LHPVALAALFHYKFIRIQPFDDGNGRLARILMNMLLMRAGYPPSVIKAAEKEAYYVALRKADGDDLNAFVAYVGTVLVESLELYLKGARGESIEDLDDFDKKLALFKKGLDGKKEKVKKSEQVLRMLYKEFIFEFIKDLKLFSLKFEDLFFQIDFLKGGNISYDETFFYLKPDEIERDYLFHDGINLSIRLKEFKHKPSTDIKINVELYFSIDYYKVVLSLDKKNPKLEIIKEYNQIPEKKEWMSLINITGDKILKELEEAIKK
jgi:hypothetical protein